MSVIINTRDSRKLASFLLASFFIVSVIEIFAEYKGDKLLVLLTKPLILPLLIAYYLRRSRKANLLFVSALSLCWVAELLSMEDQNIVFGLVFFIIYKVLVVYIVLKRVKVLNYFSSFICAIPFAILFGSVLFLVFAKLANSISLYLLEVFIAIFLGGLSLSNYLKKPSKSSTLLFISTMILAFSQFVFIFKFHYLVVYIFQATSMVLFVLGQFILTTYLLYVDRRKQRVEVVDHFTEIINLR